MRRLLYIACVFLALSACMSKGTPEEEAAKAAQSYYALLVERHVNEFLDGRLLSDSLPEDYRLQLQQVYEQYVQEMDDKHEGIREVRVSENVARRDSVLQLTYAFLILCFGDSTQEEITVPMVEQDGVWKMK